MILKYRKYIKKWIISYKGQAIAVGNTPAETLMDAIRPTLLQAK